MTQLPKNMNAKLAYIRVSKADGEQSLDLQLDAMKEKNIHQEHIYKDYASGARDKRPGLQSCLKALREGDTLSSSAPNFFSKYDPYIKYPPINTAIQTKSVIMFS